MGVNDLIYDMTFPFGCHAPAAAVRSASCSVWAMTMYDHHAHVPMSMMMHRHAHAPIML